MASGAACSTPAPNQAAVVQVEEAGGRQRRRHPTPGQETERRGDRSGTAQWIVNTDGIKILARCVMLQNNYFYSPPLAAYGGG
jgi:hypothetical protein